MMEAVETNKDGNLEEEIETHYLHTQNRTSKGIDKLFSALAKAQGEMQSAKKTETNSYYKSKYADLATLMEAARPALSANGLCITQVFYYESNNVFIETILGHSSGQFLFCKSVIPSTSKEGGINCQSLASLITYMKRQYLSAIIGIAASGDDDGEKAMNRETGVKKMVNKYG